MDFADVQSTVVTYLHELWDKFQRIPGSAIIIRYVKSSYQNDPIRSAVEFVLFLFAVHYLLAPKYSTKQGYVELSEGVRLLSISYAPPGCLSKRSPSFRR